MIREDNEMLKECKRKVRTWRPRRGHCCCQIWRQGDQHEVGRDQQCGPRGLSVDGEELQQKAPRDLSYEQGAAGSEHYAFGGAVCCHEDKSNFSQESGTDHVRMEVTPHGSALDG